MTAHHGFTLLREALIEEIACEAKLFCHDKTGAELMSLSCADENKVFGISFRTPPVDSTGVAHILEHAVLCGSKKYPVKEPFVELLKSSLQTFLNAFTYPDKTCYPVASTNPTDLYNLMAVYLDAVFHPRITEEIFQQEGWHFELSDTQEALLCQGVVYNEMKGAYSSPDSLLHEFSQRTLFPDTAYGIDSGGDPKEIPQLSYETFHAFHRDYYHPSNARLWMYGDDPEEDRLAFLNAHLEGFSRREVHSAVPLQEAFSVRRELTLPYAAGKGGKALFTRNWLLCESCDVATLLALGVLEHVLIGLPSSPLRRALVESGLGEDIAGVGLEDELRQTFFSIGLKGMDPDAVDQAEAVIEKTLGELVSQGIESAMIEAAVNRVEFALREGNTGRFPRGLALMLESLTTWLYEADPFISLAFEQPLATLKTRLAAGQPVLEDCIQQYFLDNTHSSRVLLLPDPDLAEKNDKEEREILATALAQMTPQQVADIAEKAKALHAAQIKPDSAQALATIPILHTDDIAKQEQTIPSEATRYAGCRIYEHDLPTRGIVYVDVGIDLVCVPAQLLFLVPVFGRALFEMGTQTEDFAALGMRIARKTGGLFASPFVAPVLDSPVSAVRLFLRGKATAEHAEELFILMQDVLSATRWDNKERFRQIVLEEKVRLEQQLIPAGHMVVMTRLRARHNRPAWLTERMEGVSCLFALRELLTQIDTDWPSVLARLETLSRLLVTRTNLVLNMTGSAQDIARLRPAREAFLCALPMTEAAPAHWEIDTFPDVEGLSLPAQVNYTGSLLDLSRCGYTFKGSHMAVTRYARMGYLWDRIRVQGGAYGAFCSLDHIAGNMAFVSYRDPNIDRTLAIYEKTGEFFNTISLSQRELTKSIIAATGELDAYLLPDAQGFTALTRELTNSTKQWRAARRNELLNTRVEDFRAFGETLLAARHEATVVLGSPEAMELAQQDFTVTRVL